MWHPRTIREANKPFLVARHVLGMGIFEYPRGRPRPFLSLAYTLLILAIYGYISNLAVPDVDVYYMSVDSPLRSMLFKMLFFGNAVLTFVTTVVGLCRTKPLSDIVLYVEDCEKRMCRLGAGTDYRRIYRMQIYMLVLLLLTFAVFVTIDCYWALDNDIRLGSAIVFEISVCYTLLPLVVTDLSFLSWTRYWLWMFQHLNEALRAAFPEDVVLSRRKNAAEARWDSDEGRPVFALHNSFKDRKDIETIRTIKQLHLALIKGAKITNRTYGIHLLISMTVSFSFSTCLLYYAYTIRGKNMSSLQILREVFTLISWIGFYTVKIAVISHACARASAEAARIGETVCELYEPSRSREFRKEVREFTLQLIQNPLNFTACGFFVMNHTFVHRVIGTISTYLVILIQVGDIPPSDLGDIFGDSPNNATEPSYT